MVIAILAMVPIAGLHRDASWDEGPLDSACGLVYLLSPFRTISSDPTQMASFAPHLTEVVDRGARAYLL
jgi:hypothetical protein